MARAIISYSAKNREKQRIGRKLSPHSSRSRLLQLLCCAVFLAGMAAGLIIIFRQKRSDLFVFLATTAQMQVVRCCANGFLYTAAVVTAARAVSIVVLCVTANSALGIPFIFLGLLANGCGMGLLGSYLCKEFGLKGILLSALLVELPGAVYAWAYTDLCARGTALSRSCFAAAFLGSADTGIERAETAFVRSLKQTTALTIAAGLLQGLLYTLFGRFII